jgi:hypothetical protein
MTCRGAAPPEPLTRPEEKAEKRRNHDDGRPNDPAQQIVFGSETRDRDRECEDRGERFAGNSERSAGERSQRIRKRKRKTFNQEI